MVILVVIGAAAATAVVIGVSLRQWPASDPAAAVSASVGRELQDGGRMASLLRARLDPGTATGLALTVASIGVVLGGILTGVLLYLVESHAGVLSVDTSIADWAAAHASSVSTAFLRLVTQLGSTPVVIAVAAVTGVVEFRRLRSRSLWLFLLLVVGGGTRGRESHQARRGAGETRDRSTSALLRHFVPQRPHRHRRGLLRSPRVGPIPRSDAGGPRDPGRGGRRDRRRGRMFADAVGRPLVHRCPCGARRRVGLVRLVRDRDGRAIASFRRTS